MERVTITWGAGRACMILNMEEVAECYSTKRFKKILRTFANTADNWSEVLVEMLDEINRIYKDTTQAKDFSSKRLPDLAEKKAATKSKMLQAEYYKTFTIREGAAKAYKEAVKEHNAAKRALDNELRKIQRFDKQMDKLAEWLTLLME